MLFRSKTKQNQLHLIWHLCPPSRLLRPSCHSQVDAVGPHLLTAVRDETQSPWLRLFSLTGLDSQGHSSSFWHQLGEQGGVSPLFLPRMLLRLTARPLNPVQLDGRTQLEPCSIRAPPILVGQNSPPKRVNKEKLKDEQNQCGVPKVL